MENKIKEPTYVEQLEEKLKEKDFNALDKEDLVFMSQDIKNSYISLQNKILSIRNNSSLSIDENNKQIKDSLFAFSGKILSSLSYYTPSQKEIFIDKPSMEQQEPFKSKVKRNR